MTTPFATPFLETEILLAVMEDFTERAEELIARLERGEADRFYGQLQFTANLVLQQYHWKRPL